MPVKPDRVLAAEYFCKFHSKASIKPHTKYDEPLVRRLIEKVTVYEDKVTVEFKSGVTVDVEK